MCLVRLELSPSSTGAGSSPPRGEENIWEGDVLGSSSSAPDDSLLHSSGYLSYKALTLNPISSPSLTHFFTHMLFSSRNLTQHYLLYYYHSQPFKFVRKTA